MVPHGGPKNNQVIGEASINVDAICRRPDSSRGKRQRRICACTKICLFILNLFTDVKNSVRI